MRPYVDLEKCTGCGTCFALCPTDPNVFELKGDPQKSHVVHPEACIDCKECEISCPEQAITLKEK